MAENDKSVVLENVRIIFRNFRGKEGQYNREGERNFAVLLTEEMADGLNQTGWNVKTTREREVDDETVGGEPYLPVSVNFKGPRPPRIVLITSRGKTDLGEDEVGLLDFADIQNVDLIVNPYDWTVNGLSGRKAYLKSIFVTINEDALELKYSEVRTASAPHELQGEE